MVDRYDRLRHERIAQHASVWRENSQVSEALVHYSPTHAKVSTFGAHVSPSSSSRRRRMSPTCVSLPPSSLSDRFHLFRRQKYPSHRWYLRH